MPKDNQIVPLIQIKPVISTQTVEIFQENQFNQNSNLTLLELREKLQMLLLRLKGSKFINFFDSEDKKKLARTLTLLSMFPYDHFERFSFLYERKLNSHN